jgi:hypothetical protein
VACPKGGVVVGLRVDKREQIPALGNRHLEGKADLAEPDLTRVVRILEETREENPARKIDIVEANGNPTDETPHLPLSV